MRLRANTHWDNYALMKIKNIKMLFLYYFLFKKKNQLLRKKKNFMQIVFVLFSVMFKLFILHLKKKKQKHKNNEMWQNYI